MRTRWVLLGAFAGAVLSAGPTPARADGVYITLIGQRQGRFHGPSQYQGRLLGLTFSETSLSLSSHQSGQAAGQTLSSYRMSADWGSALPQLHQAIATDEQLEVKFEFFTQSGGHDQVYYVIDMTAAHTKELTVDFDASATPEATVMAEFVSTHVTFTDPATPTAASAPSSSSPSGVPGTVAGRTLRATPVITMAQTHSLARIAVSPSDPPPVTEAYLTVSGSTFHNEVAGPPAKTAQLRTFELKITAPISATGQNTGHHQSDIEITKGMGVASADFQQALQANTQLHDVMLEFVAHPAGSASRVVYSIDLTNAGVHGDHTTMTGGTGSEAISLTFQQIKTSDNVGHIQAVDSWTTPE